MAVRSARSRPGARRLLDTAAGLPGLVVGPCTDVLAWNAGAAAVFGPPPAAGRPNVARRLFLDPEAPVRYPDRAPLAAAVVARLRRERGRRPDDARLAALVAELTLTDGQFARLWAGPPLTPPPNGPLLVRHPDVGVLSFYYQLVEPPGAPWAVVTVTPLHGTGTVGRLRRLGAAAPDDRPPAADPDPPSGGHG